MLRKIKRLSATFSASPFDAHYQMAFVYCFDKAQNYCFSLSRFPEEDYIEVMVSDQILCRASNFNVVLKGQTLTAELEPWAAAELDGYDCYVVELLKTDAASMKLLKDALETIFLGKTGLTVSDN